MEFSGLRFGFTEKKTLIEALSRLWGGHAWIEVVMHAGCMHMGKNDKEFMRSEW